MTTARAPARPSRRRRPLVRLGVLSPLFGAALACLAFASVRASDQPASFAPREETPEQFPASPGRDETFYACTPCHNFKLVAAQGMNRRQWEDSLAWMTQRHGLPPLEGEERERVLAYLENAFPPRAPEGRGGWQNPFLKR
jgi:hypothetical protein